MEYPKDKLKVIRLYANDFEGAVIPDSVLQGQYSDWKEGEEGITSLRGNAFTKFNYEKEKNRFGVAYDKEIKGFTAFPGKVFAFCFDTSGIEGYKWKKTWIYGVAQADTFVEEGSTNPTQIHSFLKCIVKGES